MRKSSPIIQKPLSFASLFTIPIQKRKIQRYLLYLLLTHYKLGFFSNLLLGREWKTKVVGVVQESGDDVDLGSKTMYALRHAEPLIASWLKDSLEGKKRVDMCQSHPDQVFPATQE